MQYLIENYGYLGILIGTFLEGETILLLGGFVAHQGYLTLPGVVLCAFAGSLLSDQVFFYIGRRHSHVLLRRHPQWEQRISRLKVSIDRYRIPIILGFRFWYGLRTVTPFTLGMSRIRWPEFIFFNIIAAMLWAVVIGCSGYLFGNVLHRILGDLRKYEVLILACLALLGATIWGLRRWRNKRWEGAERGEPQVPGEQGNE